jgi:vitamin B12 transporter
MVSGYFFNPVVIMRKIVFIIILSVPRLCFSEALSLEKIVVKNGASVSASSDFGSRQVEVIGRQELEQRKELSLTELIDYALGTDLRTRGSFGMQSDISLRGSTYEQVAVLIDGVRINDPQTGHYNLDLPFTTADIERIEIIKEPASSLYGAGAFAGSINFVTRKALGKRLSLSAMAGEHALYQEGVSFGLSKSEYSGRLSLEQNTCNGARANTDFKSRTASIYLNKDSEEGADIGALFGYQKKDFGASSFYSNLFPEEEEHTETLFAKTSLSYEEAPGAPTGSLYLRRHHDKFILARNNPLSVNYHTTYMYGLDLKLSFPFEGGDSAFGFTLGNEEINSTNLGKHSRMQGSSSASLSTKLGSYFQAEAGGRLDGYEKCGLEPSWNTGISYVPDGKIKISGTLARGFRLPSFTELYYADAANRGNPDLRIEQSDSARLGFDFRQGKIETGLDFFYRRGRNLIDWTRSSVLEAWQATNLGRADIGGVEFKFSLGKTTFSYARNALFKTKSESLSKYAFDIIKNRLFLGTAMSFRGNRLDWELSYNQRCRGETYFIGNLRLSRKITAGDCSFEPFLRVDNFSDTEYTETAGVPQPGRWVKAGVKFEW